ncbi:hypothetical protein [Nocardia bovistercoris]|uniref:Uncharacterized protein n=1 Tax=Nocardia bovistercoris TaxID=2785916 RepID=A0A931IBL5_9NOCA|nr:hypothetical protein [Nocardia bovistercoris]MBH0778061.1 hypothetical protein [Nocardia bovistercoris]
MKDYHNERVDPSRRRPSDEPVLGDLIAVTSSDILDYFAKCPHCGYAIQATETVKTYSRGLIERTIYHTCGLPCGWHDSTRAIMEVPRRDNDRTRFRVS